MNDINNMQVGGSHYKTPYEHWDFVHDTGLSYLRAQMVKYVTRWRRKNGMEDLQKAHHFSAKIIAEEDKALYSTLDEYAAANKLSQQEKGIIFYAIRTSAREAHALLEELMRDQLPEEEPTRCYVDQDGNKAPDITEAVFELISNRL